MIIIIILLILCLPLILMLTLYSATTAISIAVNVPVAGIDVLVEDYIELDLDRGESYEVEYIILPTEAKNKKVEFKFEPIGNEPLATFTVEGNVITPTSAGQARVVVETVDGGYSDSLNVIVYSRMVKSITSSLVDDDGIINVGEVAKIKTDFYPEVASNKGLSYKVIEGENVVSVNQSGEIRGIALGNAKVEVTSLANPSAKSIVEVTVQMDGSEVFSFANDHQAITAATKDPNGKFAVVFNNNFTFENIEVEVIGQAGVIEASYDDVNRCIAYRVIDRFFEGTVEIKLTVTPTDGEAVSKSCYVTQVKEVTVDWFDKDTDRYFVTSEVKDIVIDLNPKGADVTFKAIVEYNSVTNLAGDIQSGEEVVLEEGASYNLEGGFVSLTVINTPDGVYLRVQRLIIPNNDQLANAVMKLKLTVEDNMDQTSSEMELDEIEIMVV